MLEHYYLKVATPPPPPAPREPGDPAQFCKYAALELCGWIEEAQDFILMQFKPKLIDPNFQNSLDRFIKENYGFDINRNFLPMMAYGIGVVNYESIVLGWRKSGSKFSRMEGLIASNQYKKIRDRHAHTHFDEAVADKLEHLNSPAVVKQHATAIYDGFEELLIKLKKGKYL
jgi:hypothetical protein